MHSSNRAGLWFRAGAFALLAPAVSQAWYAYPEAYEQWQADRPFALSGLHNSVPTDRLPERMERFKAAGLNNFCWAKPANALHMFQAAHEAGLDWSCWSRGGTGAVSQAMAIPGNSWIMAGDEPGTTQDVIEIADMADWVRQTYPGRPVFANLSLPEIDHHFLVAEVQPDIFSFDHYPLQRDGQTQSHYLYNVNWGRQTAMQHALPFWMYLQAFGREESNPSYAYRIPDQSDLRFLVFSFLAHGGTGIMLYNYYGDTESMVIDTGVPDPAQSIPPHVYENTVTYAAWSALRDAAREIQNIGRALITLRPKDDVMYTGNGLLWSGAPPTYPVYNPDPPITNRPFSAHGPLLSVQIVETNEMGAVISFFEDEAGEEYFMVVNLQHGAGMSKTDGARTIELGFDSTITEVERLSRWTGDVETLNTYAGTNTPRTLTLWLEGGTGDLFKWSTGERWSFQPPPAPEIVRSSAIAVQDTTAFSFNSETGATYALEFTLSETTGTWTRSGAIIDGDGSAMKLADPRGHSPSKTYRVVRLP